MRGKRRRIKFKLPTLGLIPACAGKTRFGKPEPFAPRAHPRVCGENYVQMHRLNNGKGSSPRVRGKLNRETYGDIILGLIPACAGKTTSQSYLHR